LMFLIAVSVLAGIGILLFPLLIVLGVFLRILLAVLFVLVSIWLLGKFIMFIWESFSKQK